MWGIIVGCVQKISSVYGGFLVCTEEIPSVGEILECTEEILSVGDISRVYRRDPQCGGHCRVCTEDILSLGDF